MIFYLGGAINGCTDDEANGWRSSVKTVLEAAGYGWRDPMERDYRGRELEPGVPAEIVEGDKRDIHVCDVLIFNCARPSWGTAMEIFHGYEYGKRVVVILPVGITPSPWLVYHSHMILHGSADEAVETVLPGLALALEDCQPARVCGPNCNDYTGCDGGCRR